jgi:hypothetical protein
MEWVACSALGAYLDFAGSQPDHAFPETDGIQIEVFTCSV